MWRRQKGDAFKYLITTVFVGQATAQIGLECSKMQFVIKASQLKKITEGAWVAIESFRVVEVRGVARHSPAGPWGMAMSALGLSDPHLFLTPAQQWYVASSI